MQTSEIKWLGRELPKFAVSSLLLFLIFRWVNFSVLQSLMLIGLVGVGYEAYKTVGARAARHDSFSPYQVIIWPKFDELLLDFKLLTNAEQTKALHALWEKKDQRLISFTVLQDQDGDKDWLIYSNTENCFFSDMQVQERIEAIVFEDDSVCVRDPTASDNGKWRRSPSFFFRQGLGGYELGLEVYADWWKKTLRTNRPEVETTPDYACGWERLSIAAIPYEAFLVFNAGAREKSWKAMDRQLDLHGWKRQMPDPLAEVRDPWIRIEHKYFKVQYRAI